MNPMDIIVLSVIAVAVDFALKRWKQSRAQGTCSCGVGSCPMCQKGHCHCHADDKYNADELVRIRQRIMQEK